MINLNKNTEAILQSKRYQKIAKERHNLRNRIIITKFWYKKFEDLINFQYAH